MIASSFRQKIKHSATSLGYRDGRIRKLLSVRNILRTFSPLCVFFYFACLNTNLLKILRIKDFLLSEEERPSMTPSMNSFYSCQKTDHSDDHSENLTRKKLSFGYC